MSIATPESALSDAGIPVPRGTLPELDGKLHRYKTEGDGDRNSWYVFYQHEKLVIGVFGCWKRQFTRKWSNIAFANLSKEEAQAARQKWQEAQAVQREEEARLQKEARDRCATLFRTAPTLTDHPYLESKRVKPYGDVRLSNLEQYPDWLAVPLQDERGLVQSCQFIAEDGTKKFMFGGRVAGCCFPIPGKSSGPIIICEGYATGCSIATATGWSVVCAMNCGNLLAVAQNVRKSFPARTILFAADNDQFTDDNPGLTKAQKAAHTVNGYVAFPEFGDEALSSKPTDFNDLHGIEGILELRVQLQRAFPVFARPLGDFQLPPENDPTELLRYRYLCERGGLLMTGPTGVGKSSLLLQALGLWANGLPCFGITPTRPLTAVLVQAENDDGDIAEMRNGIATGLKFTTEQRRIFFEHVMVYTSNGLTGIKFCQEVASPLLDLHDPNLFAIDPALSFFGGDVKEQKDVGNFLRQHLNPVVYAHKCGCIISHHTNKPKSGNDDNAPKNGEWAYQGSGSAEWANWARAILSLQSSGSPGIYKLHGGKRGSRIGWKDDQEQTVFERVIIHSREKGVICWEDGTSTDLPNTGRPKSYSDDELLDLLGDLGLTADEWQVLAKKELGISEATFHRARRDFQKADRILRSVGNRKWVKNNARVP